jgi:hypothetical protein
MFTATGATKAMEHGVAVYAAGIIGMINAVGGGLMRDVLVRRVPTVLRKEIYALAALLGGILVSVGFLLHLPHEVVVLAAAPVVVLVRMLAVVLNWNLPTVPVHQAVRTPPAEQRLEAARPGPGSPRPADAEQTLELFIKVPARSVPPGRHRVAPRRPAGGTATASPRQTTRRTAMPVSSPSQSPRNRPY